MRGEARAALGAFAALAALGAGCGCSGGGGQTCGTSSPAPAQATLVTAGAASFTYEGFSAGLNGDCPVETGSRGSVTIRGNQTGSGFPLTFCVRRENDVKSGEAISLADDSFIQVVDVNGQDAAGCTYAKDTGAVASGTVTFEGFCTTSGTTYNMTLAGSIAGLKKCAASDAGPATSDPVTLMLAGNVLVTME